MPVCLSFCVDLSLVCFGAVSCVGKCELSLVRWHGLATQGLSGRVGSQGHSFADVQACFVVMHMCLAMQGVTEGEGAA